MALLNRPKVGFYFIDKLIFFSYNSREAIFNERATRDREWQAECKRKDQQEAADRATGKIISACGATFYGKESFVNILTHEKDCPCCSLKAKQDRDTYYKGMPATNSGSYDPVHHWGTNNGPGSLGGR